MTQESTASRLILLPGLGADAELFYPQQDHFGDRLTVIDDLGHEALWRSRPSMAAAADLIAEHLIQTAACSSGYVLGGMSFGGSLALEVAQRLVNDDRSVSPAAVALIASNRTSPSISRSFRVNRALGACLPRPLVRRGLTWAAKGFARREGLDDADRQRLLNMAGRVNVDQLMWGAKAIANWRYTDADAEALGVPIEQLHGRHDWVIPIAPRHVTETIDDGKHLITWTHRYQTNAWLEQVVKQHSPKS